MTKFLYAFMKTMIITAKPIIMSEYDIIGAAIGPKVVPRNIHVHIEVETSSIPCNRKM